MRKRAELFAHIQNTRSQYNLPDPLGCIAKPQNREGIVERFDDPSVQKSIAVNLEMIKAYDQTLTQLEHDIISYAKKHDLRSYALLQTIPCPSPEPVTNWRGIPAHPDVLNRTV